jgi:hypothetical protein
VIEGRAHILSHAGPQLLHGPVPALVTGDRESGELAPSDGVGHSTEMTSHRFLMFVTILLGCSPSTSGQTTADSGPADSATDSAIISFDYCKEAEARNARCTPEDTFNAAECAADWACATKMWRAEDLEPVYRCFATRECDTSDDPCVADVAGKYLADPVIKAYSESCLEKRMACDDSFADDYCSVAMGVLKDEYRTQVAACIEKPCEEVELCFAAVSASAGCSK